MFFTATSTALLSSLITIIFIASSACSSQCDVYCDGPLLAAIQNSFIFPDSKTFVDMPMKYDPDDVLRSFHELPDHSQATLINFLNHNFLPSGSELMIWEPTDYTPHPPFLSRISNLELRGFAQMLNQLWTSLGRKLVDDVSTNPQRYSIIPQKRPFIVPGERFHEFYYWDSYWIIKGLLVCGMADTAKGIILNALDLVNEYGFVPNGARVYYLNRSQPPFLSEMLLYYYQKTNDMDLVIQALPILEKEYKFWMETHVVNLDNDLVLNRYFSSNELPRPESFREDLANSFNMSSSEAQKFYVNIAAGAESGEDFSSRFFSSGYDIRTINTINIIPVDLNSILYKFESNMLTFYKAVGGNSATDYSTAMIKRKLAMDQYLFDPITSQWYDYCMENSSQIRRSYPSNWFPLWSGAWNQSDEKFKAATLDAFLSSSLIQEGGVLCTVMGSGEQWDSPNVWAPHQSLLVQSLLNLDTPKSIELAQTIAWKWINATYIGYDKFALMQEKYDGYNPGQPGRGGEYPPQKGFGWTNGVTLEFLDLYATSSSTF